MAQPELTTQQHIDRLMIQAAQQAEWTIGAHQDFLIGIGAAVNEAFGVSRSFGLPSNTPKDSSFRLPPDVPCSLEMPAFEHAIEVDSDPEVTVNSQLIDKARKICSACIVQKECLEGAESPPMLPLGVFGGKTTEERRPRWQERLDERLSGFAAVYKDVGQRLLDLVQKSDNPHHFSKELANLQKAYFLLPTEEPEVKPPKVLSETVRQILADPKMTERADMLLPLHGRRMLKHWVAAIEQEQDPFNYSSAEPKIDGISRTEEVVGRLLTELHEKTFDYGRWIKSAASFKVRRSSLVFLCLLGQDIPEGSEAKLAELARQKLSVLDRDTSGIKGGHKRDIPTIRSLLLDYYGLNGRALDVSELAMRYNLAQGTIRSKVKKAMIVVRALANDGPELEVTLGGSTQ